MLWFPNVAAGLPSNHDIAHILQECLKLSGNLTEAGSSLITNTDGKGRSQKWLLECQENLLIYRHARLAKFFSFHLAVRAVHRLISLTLLAARPYGFVLICNIITKIGRAHV